jgi:hypothetical protein
MFADIPGNVCMSCDGWVASQYNKTKYYEGLEFFPKQGKNVEIHIFPVTFRIPEFILPTFSNIVSARINLHQLFSMLTPNNCTA